MHPRCVQIAEKALMPFGLLRTITGFEPRATTLLRPGPKSSTVPTRSRPPAPAARFLDGMRKPTMGATTMDNDETTEKPRSTLTNLRRETRRSTGSTVADSFIEPLPARLVDGWPRPQSAMRLTPASPDMEHPVRPGRLDVRRASRIVSLEPET